MICKNCGGTHHSSDPLCPYCGTINELASEKESDTQSIRYKRLTISICAILTLIIVSTALLTNYYYHFDELNRNLQVQGHNRINNLFLINTYLDDKQYLRALSVAYNTDPSYSSFEHYPEVQEELRMIYSYSNFLYDIQSYIVDQNNLSYIDCSSYQFNDVKRFYNILPTSSRSTHIKEELGKSLDLYLKYYYQLADEELSDLKEAVTIDDFKIEGTAYFEGILKERILQYEKTH